MNYPVRLLLLIILLLSGCQQNNDSPDRTTSGETTAAATADSPVTSESRSHQNYQPIFSGDLAQNTLSNRMEKNFLRDVNRIDEGKLVHFPSAGVLLHQPEGLDRSTRFSGFEDLKSGVSITILTNPFSMDGTTKLILGEAVNTANSGVLFTKTISKGDRQGIFYASRETYGNQQVAKYTTAFGDENFSWIVFATFRAELEDQWGEELLRTVLNVRVSEEPRLPPGKDVDFTIRPNRLVLTDGFVDKLVFTINGIFPMTTTKEPIFQAVRSIFKVEAEDRRDMALKLISPAAPFEVKLVSTQNEVTINDLPGYEFIAVGRDSASDEPLQIYSVILFDEEGSYIMHGWVSTDNPESYIADFRALAKSFQRKNR